MNSKMKIIDKIKRKCFIFLRGKERMLEEIKEAAQIKQDEGLRLEVYADSLGYATVGYGHEVTHADNLKMYDKINQERAEALFEADLDGTIKNCYSIIKDFGKWPLEVRCILTNMAFNLGTFQLSKFHHTLIAVGNKNYNEAADHMLASLWSKQVGDRAKRLADRMRSLSNVHN